MPNIPWRKEGDKNDWYSNLRGGFRVSTNFTLITCK
jgi:collagen type V/XI/XXIV/XXVII alpha